MPFFAPVDLMAAVDAPGEDGVPVMELLAARLGHRPSDAHLSSTVSHTDLVGSQGICLEGTTDRIGVLEALRYQMREYLAVTCTSGTSEGCRQVVAVLS